MKRFVFITALTLMFVMSPYVRRQYLPPEASKVTDIDGSRDRHLHGKARRRARRAKQTPVQTDREV